MAENLNFETDSSFCYANKADSCGKYGRLYTWNAASVACPVGWHLPTDDEWSMLHIAVGGGRIAGYMLKSATGWPDFSNGSDEFSFSVLPSGFRSEKGSFRSAGERTLIWTSSNRYNSATSMFFGSCCISVSSSTDSKDVAFPVRCVKDCLTDCGDSASNLVDERILKPCKTEAGDRCEYGSLTDKRDGQVYKTVKIGEQWWMAENLSYRYLQPSKNLDSISFCYNDSLKYCEIYGRLYTWSAAMDSAGTWTTDGKGCGFHTTCSPASRVQGICPSGWHLPSEIEMNIMLYAVGGLNLNDTSRLLKSDTGWNDNYNGSDSFGFSALPAGLRVFDDDFGSVGERASFWSSSENSTGFASFMSAGNTSTSTKKNAFSVRCVKD